MNFEPTYTHESKAMPGVVVTLQRIGPMRRGAIELSISKARAKQRELSLQYAAIEKRLKDKLDANKELAVTLRKAADDNGGELSFVTLAGMDLPDDVMQEGRDLQTCLNDLNFLSRSEIHPAYLKVAILSFNDQIQYGGKAATAELLCQYGPDDLFEELITSVQENAYLTASAARNLPLPTTSNAQEDGGLENSTATNASGSDSTAS